MQSLSIEDIQLKLSHQLPSLHSYNDVVLACLEMNLNIGYDFDIPRSDERTDHLTGLEQLSQTVSAVSYPAKLKNKLTVKGELLRDITKLRKKILSTPDWHYHFHYDPLALLYLHEGLEKINDSEGPVPMRFMENFVDDILQSAQKIDITIRKLDEELRACKRKCIQFQNQFAPKATPQKLNTPGVKKIEVTSPQDISLQEIFDIPREQLILRKVTKIASRVDTLISRYGENIPDKVRNEYGDHICLLNQYKDDLGSDTDLCDEILGSITAVLSSDHQSQQPKVFVLPSQDTLKGNPIVTLTNSKCKHRDFIDEILSPDHIHHSLSSTRTNTGATKGDGNFVVRALRPLLWFVRNEIFEKQKLDSESVSWSEIAKVYFASVDARTEILEYFLNILKNYTRKGDFFEIFGELRSAVDAFSQTNFYKSDGVANLRNVVEKLEELETLARERV